MPAHTDHQFEAELQELKDRLLAMGGRCEKMMHGAIRAFEEQDEAAAREVMRADKQMNADELAIDELVVRILALRNPVGRDLRFAMTATKVVTDLERIGDETVNFAERVIEMIQSGPMPELARALPELSQCRDGTLVGG